MSEKKLSFRIYKELIKNILLEFQTEQHEHDEHPFSHVKVRNKKAYLKSQSE
jgi:hypothetical protein